MKTKRLTTPQPELLRGQVWRMGEDRLQISMVGKWLVHYRHFIGLNKRPPTRFAEKDELGRMLVKRRAILVQA